MKNDIIVVASLLGGVLCGISIHTPLFDYCHDVTGILLMVLVFQAGLNLGANCDFKAMKENFRLSSLLFPIFTIGGTLLFSALASMLLAMNLNDGLAVGSGFGYYSLSSVLIVNFKEASIGMELASRLGAIALLTNVFREMFALIGAPIYAKRFGKLAPISAAGITAIDVCLPAITKYSGQEYVPVAVVQGIALELAVPILITFFCC
ncbi:lysine exporter LysO family protein [uncultured Bacteroides sp.]|uniref:lysine exporter LysO family protein n=1 Tax=uncultured Bacteroides sp. TaxID=162156 RepID=UPI002611832D|nr:lysine exporter LysO family protein [uncultured Bacteroides sp.]